MKKILLSFAILLTAYAFPQAGVTTITGAQYNNATAKKQGFTVFNGQQNLKVLSKIRATTDSTILAPIGTFTTVNTSTVSAAAATYTAATVTNLTATNATVTTGAVTTGTVTSAYIGNVRLGYSAKATNYTLTTTDYVINVTDSADMTLPTAVGKLGRVYIIKNMSAKTIPIKTTSSQTIDGNAAPLSATTKKSYALQSTDANWIIIYGF